MPDTNKRQLDRETIHAILSAHQGDVGKAARWISDQPEFKKITKAKLEEEIFKDPMLRAAWYDTDAISRSKPIDENDSLALAKRHQESDTPESKNTEKAAQRMEIMRALDKMGFPADGKGNDITASADFASNFFHFMVSEVQGSVWKDQQRTGEVMDYIRDTYLTPKDGEEVNIEVFLAMAKEFRELGELRRRTAKQFFEGATELRKIESFDRAMDREKQQGKKPKKVLPDNPGDFIDT